MKPIAKQLNIKQFPFEIQDRNGNQVYIEYSNGDWAKREYDSDGNEIYFENSYGIWERSEYDSNGKRTYFETSDGFIYGIKSKDTITLNGVKYKRVDE
jgi:hypothetical protein